MTCVLSPSCNRLWRWPVAVLLSLMSLALFARVEASGFTGKYHGIAAASGMSLSVQEIEERVVGKLVLADKRVYALNGTRGQQAGDAASGAQGELRLGGDAKAVAFFRLERRPLGVQFLFIPMRSDGRADVTSAQDYSFLAEGVGVTAREHVVARLALAEHVGLMRFVDEYRQWKPEDLGRIYDGLSDPEKGLIQLYDHASADILWRICETNPPNEFVSQAMLDELLDRQQTECASITPLVRRARAGALFPEFLKRAKYQFEIIRETSLCDSGESNPAKCADVSALGAPLMMHWRGIVAIMSAIAPQMEQEQVPVVVAGAGKNADSPIIPVPPLRASLADQAAAMPARHDKTVEEAEARLSLKDEGRAIARERRRGLHIPLRNPRY